MKVYVIKDGIHTLTGGVPSHYFADYERFSKRYLSAFDRVVVVGRLFNREDDTAKPMVGPGVEFLGAPSFQGPASFFKKIPEITKFAFGVARPGHAYILRMPATLPLLIGFILKLRGIKYGVELVGDPEDAYSAAVLRNRFAAMWRKIFTSGTRYLCRNAIANAYVTRSALQAKYPPASRERAASYTSLELSEWMIASAPRLSFSASRLRLVSVGMMHNSVKGFDLLLNAIKVLTDAGHSVSASIVGDGNLRGTYEAQAKELGIEELVTFHGRFTAFEDIANVLRDSDLFVLASRQEGLPRVLIEAMAQALPCVASRVGGVTELLSEECTFQADDLDSLVQKIEERIVSPERLCLESERNLRVAQGYRLEVVERERGGFYRWVKHYSNV